MTAATTKRRLIGHDMAHAAAELAAGHPIGHGFANFYAITTRADRATVRGINLMKGRPPEQVGSITAPPSRIPDVWDFGLLPAGLTRHSVLQVIDTFLGMGPFGFLGPAARHVPDHLTLPVGQVRTAQVIAPGYACPSNDFFVRSLQRTGDEFLYITSANRSRHLTGADDSPAHWTAAGLDAEFGDEPGFVLLEHPDEAVARARYPHYLPMSTTILGFQRIVRVAGDPRPRLILERHGSLHVDDVRAVLDRLGFGLVVGHKAAVRLAQRDYGKRLSD